jgi:hypothetical protein
MSVQALLDELTARGIRVEPRPNRNLHVTPKARLTPELLEAVRQYKTELLAAVAAPDRSDPPREAEAVSLSGAVLADIADAIASAPRSPFLNELAIARAARALVEVERTIRDASRSIRIEAATTARDAMNRVADAIRAEEYALAYDLLDNLSAKMRGMRAN